MAKMTDTSPNNESATGTPSPSQYLIDPSILLRQRRHDLLDSLSVIPIFTGTDTAYSLAEFKKKFSELQEFLQWTPEDALFAVKQRLGGAALNTISNLTEDIKSTSDVFQKLKERFSKSLSLAELNNAFWNFNQPENMPVAEYIALARQKAKLLVKSQGIPQTQQDTIIHSNVLALALNNLRPELRRGVIVANPTSIDDLLKIALLEEKASTQMAAKSVLVSPPLKSRLYGNCAK